MYMHQQNYIKMVNNMVLVVNREVITMNDGSEMICFCPRSMTDTAEMCMYICLIV